jgi:hypothetical protein
MYSLIRSRTATNFLVTQLPSLAAAFILAEVFYKLKSFTLECLAFLVTWFVLDWVWTRIIGVISPSSTE